MAFILSKQVEKVNFYCCSFNFKYVLPAKPFKGGVNYFVTTLHQLLEKK